MNKAEEVDMKTRGLYVLLVFSIILFLGCNQQEKIVCNKPYILVGKECCLDENDNKVCDKDEVDSTTATTLATSPTSKETTTSTTTKETTTTLIELPANYPKYINRFTVYEQDSAFIVYFYFTDEDENEIPVEGVADLKISDPKGNVILHKSSEVTEDDYIKSTIGLIDPKKHLLFLAEISPEDINKSIYDEGIANLVFTLPDEVYFNITDEDADIPQYTEEEIKQILEEEYLESATEIDKTTTRNDFRVTVIRAGYYTYLRWRDEVTDFRVDIKVKNNGNEKRYFRAWDALILLDSKQYERSYGSTFESKELYPDVVEEGYLLFEDVPDIRGKTFDIIIGTSTDEDYDEIEHKFHNIKIS